VVPPYPNTAGLPGASTVGTTNEYYTGPDGEPGNYGLGVRVPMLVLSPWSTGGWVCSETFDHTSIIQFMERRFGVHEPHITPWRRALCGDLTAAFDFGRTHLKPPLLPPTARYRPKDDNRHPDYVPVPPADPRLPRQEPGVRPSRRLGYSINVDVAFAAATITLGMHNTGTLGAHLQVRSAIGDALPSTYTIDPGRSLAGTWPTTHGYDLSVHGPNGFYRHFVGAASGSDPQVSVRPAGRDPSALLVAVHNPGRSDVEICVANAYHGQTHLSVPAGARRSMQVPTQSVGGWYDLVVTVAADRAFECGPAGRLESGQHLTSDPQLGR
jgi:phospholipase C